jgi:Reverse transcriptase (RNA-dependent DNA polymerase)
VEFSLTELDIALDKCDNTSPGLDGIRFPMLKKLTDESKQSILDLFNEIFRQGVIPGKWTHTKVVAILKPNKDPSQTESYRPISLLSCIRKLFERILLSRLDVWVEANNILSKTQYGFRKGLGTTDCLAKLSIDINTAFAQ